MNIMKVAQDIQGHSGELNIKVEDTVDNYTLALVIYTSSAFNINTIKKMTTISYSYPTQTRYHEHKHLPRSL
jgi:hypothetical protein